MSEVVYYSTKSDIEGKTNAQAIMTRKACDTSINDTYYIYVGPRNEKELKIEDNIKLSYLQRSDIQSRYPNATVNDILGFDYYGTYDGCAVVFVYTSLFMCDLKFEAEYILGDVTFYNYCELSVYNTNV